MYVYYIHICTHMHANIQTYTCRPNPLQCDKPESVDIPKIMHVVVRIITGTGILIRFTTVRTENHSDTRHGKNTGESRHLTQNFGFRRVGSWVACRALGFGVWG